MCASMESEDSGKEGNLLLLVAFLPQIRWSNTYYHLHVNCVHLKSPTFDPQAQVIVFRVVYLIVTRRKYSENWV